MAVPPAPMLDICCCTECTPHSQATGDGSKAELQRAPCGPRCGRRGMQPAAPALGAAVGRQGSCRGNARGPRVGYGVAGGREPHRQPPAGYGSARLVGVSGCREGGARGGGGGSASRPRGAQSSRRALYGVYLFVFKDAVEEGVHVLADGLVIARRPAHAALASVCTCKGVQGFGFRVSG